jgi:hypothetical protein
MNDVYSLFFGIGASMLFTITLFLYLCYRFFTSDFLKKDFKNYTLQQQIIYIILFFSFIIIGCYVFLLVLNLILAFILF